MKIKKAIKKISIIIVSGFVLFNIIAFVQAYKFTHFSTEVKTKSELDGGFVQTLKTLLLGVDNPRPENAETPKLSYEIITIQSNVKLECWSIKNPKDEGTVILFHGFADSKSSMLDRAYHLHSMGYNTLLVDFMGCGGSEGNITTIGHDEAQNVKSVYEYLRNEETKNIILMGTSMGSAAILKAINDYKISPEAIIQECPYASMMETISIRFKAMGLPPTPTAQTLAFWGGVQHGFNAFAMKPVEYAKQNAIPTLLIYGANDQLVTLDETERIYTNISGPKTLKISTKSGHSDYLKEEDAKWTSVVYDFLRQKENF